jgi:hypothetical protein
MLVGPDVYQYFYCLNLRAEQRHLAAGTLPSGKVLT